MATIAVGGWHHETNTFAPVKANYEAFTCDGGRPPLARGADLFEALKGFTFSVNGFQDRMTERGHRLVPLLWCSAVPSAHVTADAYERIAGMLVEDLEALMASAADRPDALYFCLHGAMVAEAFDDGEGELLRRVRDVVGPDMPIAASLDYHAMVSPAMVKHADVLETFRTYPHIDRYETGERAARSLQARLEVGPPFAKAFRQLPYLAPLNWQCTLVPPMSRLVAMLDDLQEPDAVTASVQAGFPLGDVPYATPSVIAYGRTQAAADAVAERLNQAFLDAEAEFAGTLYSPAEGVRLAIEKARSASKPIVLADTQDNPGGGGNCDTVGILEELVRQDAQNAVMGLFCDPAVATAAHGAGVDAEITVDLGALTGQPGHVPFHGTFRVQALGDGQFTATGPMYKGARMKLGPMAELRIGGVSVVVASAKQQAADQEMFRCVGIEPADQKIMVLKSSVHFRNHFQDLAEEILVVEAPGPVTADTRKLDYRNLRDGVRVSPLGEAFKRTG